MTMSKWPDSGIRDRSAEGAYHPKGQPQQTENAKNVPPDPFDGPTPSRHLRSPRTRPAVPRRGSAPTT